jgi:uncharacterized membrane protein (DUF2068 family)
LERRRPTGVTIIVVLAIIAGILLIFGGLALVALAPFISQIKLNDGIDTSNTSISINVNGTVVTIPKNALFVLGGFIGILGAMLIALGIADFVVAWGLWKGKGWAWIVTIIINIISVVLNIISIVAGSLGSIGSLIINGVLIYYLYRPNVKSYFNSIKSSTV